MAPLAVLMLLAILHTAMGYCFGRAHAAVVYGRRRRGLGRRARQALRLLSVSHPQELHGQYLVARSGGVLRRGTVYVTLNALEECGLVESREEADPVFSGGPKRRLYRITEAGRARLRQEDP
jgi:DNA-binding PadR family transcriptional regulator